MRRVAVRLRHMHRGLLWSALAGAGTTKTETRKRFAMQTARSHVLLHDQYCAGRAFLSLTASVASLFGMRRE